MPQWQRHKGMKALKKKKKKATALAFRQPN
jgi:hypothetical protein